ncbi:uncharacterized protein [Dermacentor albipictus]|uniref:uncharacterized protein n=1 Tax=Dermacentor albipictus TaxID=60249 RepID=UPI0038FC18A7
MGNWNVRRGRRCTPAEREHGLAVRPVRHQGVEFQWQGAAAAMSQNSPPRPPDPREDGYDYRLDVSTGEKKDDHFWGEEIVKPSRKLSFERDIRVQEFKEERSPSEVRKLVRSPDTKARAAEPSLDTSGSISTKSRRSHHRKRKKRKSRRKKKKKKKKKRSRDDSSTTATTGETTESREGQSLGASLSQLLPSGVANFFTADPAASPPMNERAMDAAAIGEPAGVMQPADVTAAETLPPKRKRKKHRRSSREVDASAFWTPASGGEAMATGSPNLSAQQWVPDTADRQGDHRRQRYPAQAAYDQQAHDTAAYTAALQQYQHTQNLQRLEAEHLNRLYQQVQQVRSQIDAARQQAQGTHARPAQFNAGDLGKKRDARERCRDMEKAYEMEQAAQLRKIEKAANDQKAQEARERCREMEKAYEMEQAAPLRKMKEVDNQKAREACERCHELEKAYEMEQAAQLRKIEKAANDQKAQEARERCREMEKAYEMEQAAPLRKMKEVDNQKAREARERCHDMEKAYEMEQAAQLRKIEEGANDQKAQEACKRCREMEKAYEMEQAAPLRKMKEVDNQKAREARERCHDMEKAYEMEQAALLRKMKEVDNQKAREARERCHELEKAYEMEQAAKLRKIEEAADGQKAQEARDRCHEIERAYEMEQAAQLRKLKEVDDQKAQEARERCHEVEKAYEMEQAAQLRKIEEAADDQKAQEARERCRDMEKAYEMEQAAQLRKIREEQKEERQRKREARARCHEMEKAYELEQAAQLKMPREQRQAAGNLQREEYLERERYQRAQQIEGACGQEQHRTLEILRKKHQDEAIQQQYQKEQEAERHKYQRPQQMEKAYEKEQKAHLWRTTQQKEPARLLSQKEEEEERQRYQRAQQMEKAYEKEQKAHLPKMVQQQQPVQPLNQKEEEERQRYPRAQQMEKAYENEQKVHLWRMTQQPAQPAQPQEVELRRHQRGEQLNKGEEQKAQMGPVAQKNRATQQPYQQEPQAEHLRYETAVQLQKEERARSDQLSQDSFGHQKDQQRQDCHKGLETVQQHAARKEVVQQLQQLEKMYEARHEQSARMPELVLKGQQKVEALEVERKPTMTLFTPPGFGPVGSHLRIKTKINIDMAPLSPENVESIEETVILEDYLGGNEDGTFGQESFQGHQRGLTTAPPVVTIVEKPTIHAVTEEAAVSNVTVIINPAPSNITQVIEQPSIEQPKSEVLHLLATALGIDADDSHQDDITGQEASSTNTLSFGEVDTMYEDTSSTPAPSKYTESPGPQTVVGIVQDCFQVMDEVIKTEVSSTQLRYSEVQGAETVVRMVHDCFQVMDDVVQSEPCTSPMINVMRNISASSRLSTAETNSRSSANSASHRLVGENKKSRSARRPLGSRKVTSAGSVRSGKCRMSNFDSSEAWVKRGSHLSEDSDSRRLPSFPGLNARVEVAVNRPDVVGLVNRPDIVRLRSTCLLLESVTGLVQDTVNKDFASAKANILSAGDPLRTTVAAYVVEDDDAKKKKRRKKKKKRSKKKKKKKKRKKSKKKKKKKRKKKSKKKKKKKKKKKSKKKKRKKKKSDESSPTSSPSSSSPSSSIEKVGDGKTPSPTTSKATTGITKPMATVSVSSRSYKSTQTDDLLRGSRQRIQRGAYLPPAGEGRRRRRHRIRTHSDTSDSSSVSQRYRIVTHVVLGDGSSAARLSGSGSEGVYQLPKPRSKSKSRQRIDTRGRVQRTSSQCSNCGGTTTPPMLVERPIIIEAPTIPSPPYPKRDGRLDDDDRYDRRQRRRRHHRSSGSRSSDRTSSESRHRRRHRRRRRRSHERRPRRYYVDDPEIPGRPGRPMYASPPSYYYGDPMGVPAPYMRRRARSFERVPPRFPRYVAGYGPPVMPDMPPVPFESSGEAIPPVSMMITTNMMQPSPVATPSPLPSRPLPLPALPPPLIPQAMPSPAMLSAPMGQPSFTFPQGVPPSEPPLPTKKRSLTVEVQTPPASPPVPTSYTASAPLLTYQNNRYGTNSSSSDSWKHGYAASQQPTSFSSTITTSSFSGAAPQAYGGKAAENPWMAPYNYMRRNFDQGNFVLSIIFLLGIAACVIALIGQYGRYRESRDTIEEEEEGAVMHGPWLFNLSGVASTLLVRGYKFCHAPDCKREADRLASVLASGPCDSFYDYVCSRRWASKRRPADAMTADDGVVQDIQDSVWRNIKNDRKQSLAAVMWRSCLDVSSLGAAPFLEFFNASGLAGWPFHEAPLDVDTLRVAGRLVRLLRLATLLSLRVERGFGQNVILVLGHAAPPLDLRDFRSNASMTTFVKRVETTMKFLASDVNDTTTRAVEVLNFCLRLVNLNAATNNSASKLGANFSTFLDVAVGDLIDLTGTNVHINLESPKYVNELSQLLSAVSPRAVLNYLGFYTVDHMWSFSPEGAREEVKSGRRERRCLQMTERAVPSQVLEIGFQVYKNRLNWTDLRRRTNETKKHIIDGVRSLSWMDHAMKVKVIERIDATSVELFFPPHMPKTSPVAAPPPQRSAFELYQRAVEESFAASVHSGTTAGESLFSRHSELGSHGVLRVPLAAAAMASTGPSPSPYVALLRSTRLNVRLAKALLQVALADDIWTAAARGRYRALQSCFLSRFPAVRDPLEEGRLVPKPAAVARDDVLEHVAVALAHVEFRRGVQLLRHNMSDYRLADAQAWSSEQLFFVSYAESECQAYDDELAFRRFLARNESPARQRVDMALAHDPTFHRAFHCHHGFPMRPRHSCSFW